MDENEFEWSGIPSSTVKGFADMLAMHTVPDAALTEVTDDVNYRLADLIQLSLKFMRKGKRCVLVAGDIDRALKLKGYEPLYGFSKTSSKKGSFMYASGGGRDVYFKEEKELNLTEFVSGPSGKAVLEPTLKTHWLAVEGKQPAIPENVPPIADQKTPSSTQKMSQKSFRSQKSEVNVKTSSTHLLSVEQQFLYKELTEAVVCGDEGRRSEGLASLSVESGLQPILPRLALFIREGFLINISQRCLSVLVYLCRMVHQLLKNPSVDLSPFLHDLLPGIYSCIFFHESAQEQHYALRELAAKTLREIYLRYKDYVPDLQSRLFSPVIKVLNSADSQSLPVIFGALTAIMHFEISYLREFVVKNALSISKKLQTAGTKSANSDKDYVECTNELFLRCCVSYCKEQASQSGTSMSKEECINTFGEHFGRLIFIAAQKDSFTTHSHAAMSSGGGTPSRGKLPPSINTTSSPMFAFASGSPGPSTPTQKVFVVRGNPAGNTFGGKGAQISPADPSDSRSSSRASNASRVMVLKIPSSSRSASPASNAASSPSSIAHD